MSVVDQFLMDLWTKGRSMVLGGRQCCTVYPDILRLAEIWDYFNKPLHVTHTWWYTGSWLYIVG